MKQSNNKCVIFVANRSYALTNSRIAILSYFIRIGWKVVVLTDDSSDSNKLSSLGITVIRLLFNRGGLAFLSDLKVYFKLCSLYKQFQPNLIHHFHAKPVILGTLAARKICSNDTIIFNTITGLGHAFIMGGFVAKLASFGYRISLSKANMTIFQNSDDWSYFTNKRWVNASNSMLITSSGVDTKKFRMFERLNHDPDAPIVIMLGRLIRQKGILEFANVAPIVKKIFPRAEFILAGEIDMVHPDFLDPIELEKKQINYIGKIDDVLSLYAKADLLLFPSYREGVPRVVLEASATGLATVAFDVPGVREVVVNNKTGYLVNFGDVAKLASMIIDLLKNKEKRLFFGKHARMMVENEFDIDNITNKYLEAYRKILPNL